MKNLDVISLHYGLERRFGSKAAYASDRSNTKFTHLVAPDGLPVHVGWFDNSKKSYGGGSYFAITTYPDKPRSIHHRLMLEQQPWATGARLVEEDSAGYLEGYDDWPTTYPSTLVEQPALTKVAKGMVLGSFVLDTTKGDELAKFAWNNDYDVSAVREYGTAIIKSGDVLAKVGHWMVRNMAFKSATEAPVSDTELSVPFLHF